MTYTLLNILTRLLFTLHDDYLSAPALVVFPELPDFLEVILKEFRCLLAVAVVELARLPSELFGEDLGWHLAVEVFKRGVEAEVVLK